MSVEKQRNPPIEYRIQHSEEGWVVEFNGWSFPYDSQESALNGAITSANTSGQNCNTDSVVYFKNMGSSDWKVEWKYGVDSYPPPMVNGRVDRSSTAGMTSLFPSGGNYLSVARYAIFLPFWIGGFVVFFATLVFTVISTNIQRIAIEYFNEGLRAEFSVKSDLSEWLFKSLCVCILVSLLARCGRVLKWTPFLGPGA
jgi:hypothetical protein